MIVIDSSALIAIILGEAGSGALQDCLRNAGRPVISAATLTECLIVAGSRGVEDLVQRIVTGTPIAIIPHDEELAYLAAEAHRRFGRGKHPAQLNFGDCFAYALAKARDLPLLYVGEDFARTDVRSALKTGA